MKATEQYFHVVLFIVLYKVKSVNETLVCEVIEHYFHVALFVKLRFAMKSVGGTLQRGH